MRLLSFLPRRAAGGLAVGLLGALAVGCSSSGRTDVGIDQFVPPDAGIGGTGGTGGTGGAGGMGGAPATGGTGGMPSETTCAEVAELNTWPGFGCETGDSAECGGQGIQTSDCDFCCFMDGAGGAAGAAGGPATGGMAGFVSGAGGTGATAGTGGSSGVGGTAGGSGAAGMAGVGGSAGSSGGAAGAAGSGGSAGAAGSGGSAGAAGSGGTAGASGAAGSAGAAGGGPVPCTTTDDCITAGLAGQICGDLTGSGSTTQLVCTTPNPPPAGDLGAACSADGECRTNYCFSLTSSCTAGCTDDADCGSPFACTHFLFSGSVRLGLCVRGCAADAECSGGQICAARTDDDGTTAEIDTICVNPNSSGSPLGTDCTTGSDCRSGTCLTVTGATTCTSSATCMVGDACIDLGGQMRCGQRKCTSVCRQSEPSDCPSTGGNTFTSCGPATFGLPGGGTQNVDLCGP